MAKNSFIAELTFNHLSKVVWDRKIITEFTRSISSFRKGKPGLIERIYVRWNKIKNRAQRGRRWSIEEKKQDIIATK